MGRWQWVLGARESFPTPPPARDPCVYQGYLVDTDCRIALYNPYLRYAREHRVQSAGKDFTFLLSLWVKIMQRKISLGFVITAQVLIMNAAGAVSWFYQSLYCFTAAEAIVALWYIMIVIVAHSNSHDRWLMMIASILHLAACCGVPAAVVWRDSWWYFVTMIPAMVVAEWMVILEPEWEEEV